MLSGIRVLIVEDEPSVAATLSDMVEDVIGAVWGAKPQAPRATRLARGGIFG
jgi:response regulator of citrate/malate metabolism